MNPLAYLLPALNAALTATPLLWAGVAVPVEQHLSKYPPGPYVLIEQPTDADAGGSTACVQFSCTVLLNVVTQFAKGQVTSAPAEAIVSQINARLRRQRLALGPNWDCQPGQLEPAGQLVEDNGQQTLVRRLLRYRWQVYYSGPVEAPPPVPTAGGALAVVFTYPFVSQKLVRVEHGLGRHVVVEVYDQAGNTIEGDVSYIDLNTIEVAFSQPLSGTVVLR